MFLKNAYEIQNSCTYKLIRVYFLMANVVIKHKRHQMLYYVKLLTFLNISLHFSKCSHQF